MNLLNKLVKLINLSEEEPNPAEYELIEALKAVVVLYGEDRLNELSYLINKHIN